MFLLMSVCLSVSLLEYLKSYERILMKFAGEVDVAQGTKGLNFGGDPDYDPDP